MARRSKTSAAAASARTSIDFTQRNEVALVTLNRPKRHNAFDESAVRELTEALRSLDATTSVRAIVLLGAGESFCAGEDLDWMRRIAGFAREENVADANALARLLRTLHEMTKPTIARVHGPALGGGVGLVACCDIAIATQDATFALSEAKHGLIPATIAPYVVEAIGPRHARRYMMTGERFGAAEAYRIGLVHDIVATIEALDGRINELLGELFTAAPKAQCAAKALVRAVTNCRIDDRLVGETAQRIADVRASDEGREGVAAFLERRPAAWLPAALRKKK
ncbi:MAG TPA: enoyl-CoA hydratase/isomerase family protein [Casimicrobiaceae bacterium]|nr:enoyl-CoA hydratase/isomerase family protein [Casimicrobiaceae bacterium]